jgi:exodeoxyribonuclease V alpha subunit
VDLITYHDEQSLYTVLKLVPEEGYDVPKTEDLFASGRLTAVGRWANPMQGARVRLLGRWGRHASHGSQFEFEVLQPLVPVDAPGLKRYLTSKAFPGVGKTLAERIVGHLGMDTLRRIAEEEDCLAGIRGLKPAVAATLREAVMAQTALHETLAFLHGVGLGPIQAHAALTRLGPGCETRVGEDPYALMAVPGLGFALADRVAQQLGLADDDPRRLRAALVHALERAADDGHTFLARTDLLETARELLRVSTPDGPFEDALAALGRQGELVVDEAVFSESEGVEPVYLPYLHTSEVGASRSIRKLLAEGPSTPLANAEALTAAEADDKLELHAGQREAVLTLLSHPVALLTGGPGVGKTTIIRFVANLAEAAGARIRLASPTGRAAKRLSEATGRPASTIHRLLGFDASDGGFEHGTNKPLKADLVIVDEISMLDVVLAHHLFKALGPKTRLVLVGDPNQLPSVGPGNVLGDLIDSRCVPTARLTHIYRQAAKSLIVKNAHRILEGEMPDMGDSAPEDSDFFFFPSEEPEATADLLLDVVTRRLEERFGIDWTRDVQVIAPMYRGECGVDALNDRLREAQGVGGREVVRGDQRWRTGDRVIHTRNDYEKEVFNGDMGVISTVTEDGIVTVRYPEQDVVYSGAELSQLLPAFAITVHRSQGGEFPVVVLPMVRQHAVMLQRNLLYTAVTRAQRMVVLVGSRRALAMAVENTRQVDRHSALSERLAAGTAN